MSSVVKYMGDIKGSFFLRANFQRVLICGQNEGFYSSKKHKPMEVEVVRTRITLECTECKQRNYNTTKDKKVHPDRMETKKYCRFCQRHTLHKETR